MPGKALTLFSRAMAHFHKRRYEKAETTFSQLIEGYADQKELTARAQLFLQLCEKHLAGTPREFRVPEDHYYRAVVLSNRGEHGAAIQHLEEALGMLQRQKKAEDGPAREETVRYLLAVSFGLRGERDPALDHLKEAIRIDESIRVRARNSPDFLPLREDRRFRALVGPRGGAKKE
jgi:tetratricopeptide (TPR) repeat protein